MNAKNIPSSCFISTKLQQSSLEDVHTISHQIRGRSVTLSDHSTPNKPNPFHVPPPPPTDRQQEPSRPLNRDGKKNETMSFASTGHFRLHILELPILHCQHVNIIHKYVIEVYNLLPPFKFSTSFFSTLIPFKLAAKNPI